MSEFFSAMGQARAGQSVSVGRWPASLGLFLLIGILLVPTLGRAESPKTLQVLALSSGDALEQAKILTAALKRAVSSRAGWALPPGDYAQEVLTAGLNCVEPPNADCLKKIHAKIGEKRFLWGTVAVTGDSAVADLHLAEVGQAGKQTALSFPANPATGSEPALVDAVEQALGRLLAEVTVNILSGLEGAEILVNGHVKGRIRDGQFKWVGPAGTLHIMVRSTDGLVARRTLTAVAGTVAQVSLTSAVASRAGAAVPEAGRRQHVPLRPVLAYGSIGLGAALAVTGTAFWINSSLQKGDTTWQAYRDQVPVSQDPCDRAEADHRADIVERCTANRTSRLASFILIPAGLVAAGVGVGLLVTGRASQEGQQPANGQPPRQGTISVHPGVGSHRAVVDFRYTF